MVIDTTPIVVARGLLDQRYPQVEWNGQNWLVAWLSTREDDSYSFDDTYSVEIRAARVAPDGTVLDQTPIVVRASTTNSEIWPREVVFDGTNWIVVWLGTADAAPSVRSVFAARVTGAGAVLDAGEGKEIYRHNSASLDDPDLAFGGDGFLLTFAATTTAFSASNQVRAIRLSPALDQVGTSFRVNVGSALGFSEPRVASDGAAYFVVWDGSAINNTAGPDRVYGSRVSSAGAVLDPDGIVIAQLGTQGTQADLCWDGTRYFISYDSDFNEATQTYSDKDVYAKRVSAAGAVLDAAPIFVKVAPGTQTASAVAPGAEGGVEIVWYDVLQGLDVRGAFVSGAGAVGPDTPVSLGAPSQNLPRIAPGGDGFLMVYKSVTSGDVRILAQRLDAAGAPVGLPSLIFGGTPSIDIGSVAWNGTVFLVTWADGTTGVRQINAKRVSAAGAVLDAAPIPIMQGSLPDVAALGDTFLVVGVRRIGISSPAQNIIAVRVSGAGVVLG
ncbi:MAG: hypothetical protein H0X44_09380, partial [Acidobacteria bacterium]|nr:hypothetical protein [Acidobacteriota bacterium]